MEIILASFTRLVTDPSLWALMLGAIVMGMVLGAIPGIGGRVGIVLAIPFVFNLDLLPGAVFLVAMHAVVHTGGAIPSILIGMPGSGADAATVCDGFPMTQKGEAGRALGASLAASAVGGVIGAGFLAALMPIAQPAILAFGPAEFFFLALFGITLVGAMSGSDVNKGVIVGGLGLMMSFVGAEAQTGTERFTMGQPGLGDGLDVVTAVLGIFAVPECLSLAARPSIAPVAHTSAARYPFHDVLTGVIDVGRHWGLTLRTSLIGAVIGLIPGLGADVASWICYGHAAQTSTHPERFGHGAVEGVIGPEAANNSREGGALLPTLFFGIPGSTGMALMLSALILLGLQPGPAIATDHLDLVWTLIWTLVISNVLAALMFLGVARWLALVIHVRAGLIVPFVLLLSALGAYLAGGRHSLLLLVVFGALGMGLTRAGWPRAPFVIGVVLGPIMEVSLHQALTIWGPAFVLRPLALALACAIFVSVAVSLRRAKTRTGGHSAARSDVIVAAVMFAVFILMAAAASRYPPQARLVPLVIGIPAALLSGYQLVRDISTPRTTTEGTDGPFDAAGLRLGVIWLLLFIVLVLAGGFTFGGPIAVAASQRFWLKESWKTSVISGVVALLLIHVVLQEQLGVVLFEGWIESWVRG